MGRLSRLLIVPAALAAALTLPAAAQAQSGLPRVIAGSDVSSTAHPYQVRLTIRRGSSAYQCGGVIRDATHVMTAAHCVVSSGTVASPGSVTVHYGNANRAAQASALVYSVRPSPEYVAGYGSYDAALLTLSAPLAGYGKPNVRPAVLASATTLASAVGTGAPAVVSGWGLTEFGTLSQNLRATTVALRSDSTCRNVYGRSYASARFVCAGGTSALGTINNPDSCSGDSGGPLVLATSSGYALVGLVSFGPAGGCGRGGLPGAYTEVSNPNLNRLLTGQTAPPPPPAPVTPAPPPPAPAAPAAARLDRTPPRASVAGLRCRKRKCVVRLAVRDNRGAARSVLASASGRVRVCATRRAGRRSCRVAQRTRTLRVKRIPGGFRGTFQLTPGSYRFRAVVWDAAGNRSRAVTLAFRVRR